MAGRKVGDRAHHRRRATRVDRRSRRLGALEFARERRRHEPCFTLAAVLGRQDEPHVEPREGVEIEQVVGTATSIEEHRRRAAPPQCGCQRKKRRDPDAARDHPCGLGRVDRREPRAQRAEASDALIDLDPVQQRRSDANPLVEQRKAGRSTASVDE
ncbi:MAG TPA: hypothetical protein DCP38_02590 [Acidobacteria bacterium]|nr:hypothetical protein [Acidobacteriota bacterium]